MKRLVILGLSLLSLAACQKKSDVTPLSTEKTRRSVQKVAPTGLSSQVVVSPYGFLILADTNAYADYIEFLDSNNNADI